MTTIRDMARAAHEENTIENIYCAVPKDFSNPLAVLTYGRRIRLFGLELRGDWSVSGPELRYKTVGLLV